MSEAEKTITAAEFSWVAAYLNAMPKVDVLIVEYPPGRFFLAYGREEAEKKLFNCLLLDTAGGVL